MLHCAVWWSTKTSRSRTTFTLPIVLAPLVRQSPQEISMLGYFQPASGAFLLVVFVGRTLEVRLGTHSNPITVLETVKGRSDQCK